MKEVRFKHKHANHSLRVAGKRIVFKDGVANVSDDVADAIINLQDDDYTVKPEAAPKKKRRRKKGA
ncbi:MAG: hypothetical protein A4E25_00032 [Methanobacterium sp. PtaB.Bin024]|jgi:hypothetical protein|nr:MAG: hypothetical protein A4E25_00032 [Methanobacterium sp. PtaB.Bin024]